MLGVKSCWKRVVPCTTLCFSLKGPRLPAKLPIRRFSTTQGVGIHGNTGEESFEDFGVYEVILPEEPFVFGVSHIAPRRVPEHITKPPYALTVGGVPDQTPRRDSGKIKLGGEAEDKIRKAALLAKQVREFSATQVKVGIKDVLLRLVLLE